MKCMIVEDETLAQEVIQNHLKHLEQLQLVAVCSNIPEAIEVLRTQEIDLMFLDIQLPGSSGLHFLKTFPDPPLVIITTAYAEYALESYEFNVIDYLLKPISFQRFVKAIQKVSDRILTAKPVKENILPEYIFVKSNNRFFKVNFSEIVYIEGMKDYLKIYTSHATLVTHQTMSDMEKLLPARQFTRVHKSYIVALQYIKTIYGNTIELSKTTIPVGSNYKEKLMGYVSGIY